MAFGDLIWIKLKSVFLHITLSKVTSAFFLFTFIQCFASGLIQSLLFTTDNASGALIDAIVAEANVSKAEFAIFTKSHGISSVSLCEAIPENKISTPCHPVFSTAWTNLTAGQAYGESVEITRRSIVQSDFTVSPQDVNGSPGVSVVMRNAAGIPTNLNLTFDCAQVLVYPKQVLSNSKREDLALVAAQFWLFIISFFGIVYDSIPHILAALVFRYLSVGWSAFQIFRTHEIKGRFEDIVSGSDTFCQADLFPTYFQTRISYQIPDLVLSTTGMIVSTYLSLRLVKAYKKYIFGRAAPSPFVLRVYKWFLCVFVCLQLLVYLIVTAMGLWVDQLFHSAIKSISSFTTIYVALFIFTMVCLIPWTMLGWYSVRLERKRPMAVFLVLTFIFVSTWAIMFYSEVYRFTFLDWPYFACTTVASFMVLISAFIFGIICWRNFGKGLAHYLHTESALEKSDFEPELFERDIEAKAGSYDDTAEAWSDITVTLKFDSSQRRSSVTSDSSASTIFDIKPSPVQLQPPPYTYVPSRKLPEFV